MTILWKQIVLVSLALSAASCGSSDDVDGGAAGAPKAADKPFTLGPSQVSASEASCIDEIDAYRQANQLSPVQSDAKLSACAASVGAYQLEQGDPDVNDLCAGDPAGSVVMVKAWPSDVPDAVERTIHADGPHLLVPELKQVGCSVRVNSAGFIAVSLVSYVSPPLPPPAPKCSATAPCATGYCDYAGVTCPGAGDEGWCTDLSFKCPAFEPTQPVCGCDGKMYKNDCEAAKAGAQVSDDPAGCPVTEGKFRCGYVDCAPGAEICVRDLWLSSYYHCAPLPAACGGVASCECANEKAACPQNSPNIVGGLCQMVDGNVFVGCSEPP